MINHFLTVFLCLFFSSISGVDLKLISDPFPADANAILKENNLNFYFDNYGNLRIVFDNHKNVEQLQKKGYIEELKSIIQKKWKKRGVYIHIPLEIEQPRVLLKELGFDVYGLDPEKKHVLYLLKNGRGIPNLDNTFAAATVFIVRKNPDNDEKELLVINEYDKADLTVVGGCVDDLELISEAAVRECEEEVGIKLKERNLRLMRVSNIKIKPQNKNFIDFFFYVEVDFKTVVSIDQKEVMNYKWVPLKDVEKEDFTFDEKHFSPEYRKVILDTFKHNTYKEMNENRGVFLISNFDS